MATFLLARFLLAAVFVSGVWSQPALPTDAIVVDCVESLARVHLSAQYFQDKYVRFSAIDGDGKAHEATPTLAAQCGYTITSDFWGNVEFRASILSCYSQIVDDQSYSVMVKIDVSSTPKMEAALSYVKNATCLDYPWRPREILCETNYMEVSVGREIPLASEGYVQDQPEDWAAAFPEAVPGDGLVWQIVFHLPSGRKVMLLSAAQAAGYGINTTATRIVLRAAYNAPDAIPGSVDGVEFSIIRSTTFYKQRWILFMIDTAIACPVDDLKYTEDAIIWSIPKHITPLMVGADHIQTSSGAFGIDLQKLGAGDVRNRYVVQNDSLATTIEIPLGAPGGYYKSHVQNWNYGTTYSINIFLQNQWVDDKWGQTRHTIIKDITTPFVQKPPVVTNDTVPATRVFNATVGTFLPDVQLLFVTIGTETLTVLEATVRGYTVSKITHPNGNATYVLKVPFDDPNIDLVVTGPFRVYTLDAILDFNVIPQNQPFNVSVNIVAVLEDVVPPSAVGSCDGLFLHLVVKRGNVDQDWIPYIGNVPLTIQYAQAYGYLLYDNVTHFEITVPRASSLVQYEGGRSAVVVTVPVSLKDPAGNIRSNFSISCSYVAVDEIACFPNGTIVVTTVRKAVVKGVDLRQLVLRDRHCRPAAVTDLSATFVFTATSCGTTSKFLGNTMIYENSVLYYAPGVADALYTVEVSCNYLINGTVVLPFQPEDNPSPAAELGFGSLALRMSLSKDESYSAFYHGAEYPVVKYLQDPLYLEVELLYSQDTQLELFLEHCWATPFMDRSSTPQWDIVINSCENAADDYETVFHRVASDARVSIPGHFKRFEVKTFTFRQSVHGMVYFHCSVVICNSALPSTDQLCSKLCIPNKQRTGRSVDTDHDLRGYVSSGSVQLMAENGLLN